MQPAVAVSLQSHRECAKRSPARTQDSLAAASSLLRRGRGNPARPCPFQARWPSKQRKRRIPLPSRGCAYWYRLGETEAESVAYVVCSAIGLETGTAAQDYLGHSSSRGDV